MPGPVAAARATHLVLSGGDLLPNPTFTALGQANGIGE
jgi:hypothetical protein